MPSARTAGRRRCTSLLEQLLRQMRKSSAQLSAEFVVITDLSICNARQPNSDAVRSPREERLMIRAVHFYTQNPSHTLLGPYGVRSLWCRLFQGNPATYQRSNRERLHRRLNAMNDMPKPAKKIARRIDEPLQSHACVRCLRGNGREDRSGVEQSWKVTRTRLRRAKSLSIGAG